MTTAILLVALVVASVGWVFARENWMAAEEEVLRLCAELREANMGHPETPAQDSDA